MNLSSLIYSTPRKWIDMKEQMCNKEQLVDLQCKGNNCPSGSAVGRQH